MSAAFPFSGGARGLSLLELLIAVSAAAVLTAGAYRIFIYFQKQSLIQRRIAEVQARMIPAQLSLEKNLRRTGQGIPRVSVQRAGSSADTLGALRIGHNPSGPDTLTLRGNFDTVASQLRNPAASTSASADLELLTGTAGKFAANDLVVIAANGVDEYAEVTSVNAGSGSFRTRERLFAYPAGAAVTKVSTYRYYVASDSSLRMANPAGTARLLDKYVADLRFELVAFGNVLNAAPPWVPANRVQYVAYALDVRIPKSQGRHFRRALTGKILLRNN